MPASPTLTVRLASILTAAWLLCSCASVPPPQAFEHSARASVKKVCLVPLGVADQIQVTITNPIGEGFGVVGTLIESHRTASASTEVTGVLTQARYDVRAALTDAVFNAVRKAGFIVTRLEGARPKKETERFLSKYPQRPQVDAYLDIYAPYVGFQAPQSSVDYRPRIELLVRLVSAKDGTTLFQHHLVYGTTAGSDDFAVLVRADDGVSFRDRTALKQNASATVHALQAAIESVSWELAKQFM